MAAAEVDLPDLSGVRAAVVNWRDPEHHLAGGSERYAWELAQGLAQSGASVELLTSRDRGQARREPVGGIRVRREGGRFTVYPWTLVLLLLRRRRVDVVIDIENGIPSFAPLVLRRRTPVVLVMHHVHLDQFAVHFPRPLATLGRLLERRLMPRVYRRRPVVAVSQSTAAAMVDRLAWASPIAVVHNGSDPARAAHAVREAGRIVVLGRLVAHKHVDKVVRAVASLQNGPRPVHLDVVGRGPEEEAIRALVSELGLTDIVAVHGYVDADRKAELLGRAQLHVCASQGEGWGQVVMDAAAYGVPTLAYDVPGLRDSIRDGHTGWLLPPGTDLPDAISRALTELNDPGRASALAADCQTWAASFSWSEMRRRIALVVADVTGRPL